MSLQSLLCRCCSWICSTSLGPHQQGQITSFERIRKLALCMCAKDWSARSEDLLICFNLLTLKQRSCYHIGILSSCSAHSATSSALFSLSKYKRSSFFHKKIFLLSYVPVADSPMDIRLWSFNPYHLSRPTLGYDCSFFHDAIKLWNKVPVEISSASSPSLFKRAVHNYTLSYLM